MKPTVLNGNDYFTVKQFALLTNRTHQSIRHLIRHGNSIRKLDAIKIGSSIFIPISELTNYPFKACGRGNDVYHYDIEGQVLVS